MNPYTNNLLTAIAAYESKCGIAAPESILEELWYDYSCRQPVDQGQVREAESKLFNVHRQLSLEASDALSGLIVDLLNAYQRAAYLDGLRTGAHLLQELQ